MSRREFIDIILNSISDTFDIYHNYWFEGRKFVIYAYSYNKKDRFSTTDDAKLWDSKCYEHLFFINCDTLGMNELDDLYNFAVDMVAARIPARIIPAMNAATGLNVER